MAGAEWGARKGFWGMSWAVLVAQGVVINVPYKRACVCVVLMHSWAVVIVPLWCVGKLHYT